MIGNKLITIIFTRIDVFTFFIAQSGNYFFLEKNNIINLFSLITNKIDYKCITTILCLLIVIKINFWFCIQVQILDSTYYLLPIIDDPIFIKN